MASTANTKAVETFFAELRRIQATGASTAELSYYSPLSNLLNSVGAGFNPKVLCITEPAGQGAGRPDLGLFTSRQMQKEKPVDGQTPELGVWKSRPPPRISIESQKASKSTCTGGTTVWFW